jgi:hypothetical protein
MNKKKTFPQPIINRAEKDQIKIQLTQQKEAQSFEEKQEGS